MIDGGLGKLFQAHLNDGVFQAIETGGISTGVPDRYYCFPYNKSGWIELKQTTANHVRIDAKQVAWAERLWRVGGRSFVAVRQKANAGRRRKACDSLWLIHGEGARHLLISGLSGVPNIYRLGKWDNGPAKWNWEKIKEILMS